MNLVTPANAPGPVKSWVLAKRYSEFHALDKALNELATTPEKLPEKTWFNFSSQVVEFRRKEMERYLQAILYHKDTIWRRSRAWAAFFNLPETNTAVSAAGTLGTLAVPAANLDPARWMQEYESLYSFCSQIRAVLNDRDRSSLNGDTTVAQSKRFQARKGLKLAQDSFEQLALGLKHDGLAQGEFTRRQDLLWNIKSDLEGLEDLTRAHSSSTTQTGSLSHSEMRARASSSARNELLGTTAVPTRTSRKFGVQPQETERTRTLDSAGLLQLQQQEMHLQDKALDSIAEVVKRQKEIGMAISNELDDHNAMLEQLDEGVTRFETKMKTAEKKVNRIMKG
ncbi:hypothetical protein HDV03_001150 [Kappamyces sp. JEL0829]|nr:hypothetical protein HDV03_001150 [Kappamyces sp. JEL0829]